MGNHHVIYHRADYDGIFSGAVMLHFLELHGEIPTMHGWDYGDPIPDIPKSAELWIVDLSVEPLMSHPNLVWIDHHKSAIDKYDPNIPGIRIDGVAACRLAWAWWIGNGNAANIPPKADFIDRLVLEPDALLAVGEFDVWDKRNPLAETFQYGLAAWGLGLDNAWELLGRTTANQLLMGDILDKGMAVESYVDQTNASIVQTRGYRAKWQGLTFAVLNTARGNSLSFKGADLEGVDALMMWRHDGEKTVFSLYHAPGQEHQDLSVLAVAMGGGGHKGACGFTTSLGAAASIVESVAGSDQ